MARTILKYGAILTGVYLVAVHASNFGTVIKEGSAGAVNLEKTFQGR